MLNVTKRKSKTQRGVTSPHQGGIINTPPAENSKCWQGCEETATRVHVT
jgi:hypothetical protein